jgi:TldD protein
MVDSSATRRVKGEDEVQKLIRTVLTMMILLPGLAGAQPRARVADNDPLLQALQSEMDRSVTRLRLDDYEPPYFISYRLTDVRSTNLRASYGALTSAGGDRYRALAVNVRVGDYVDDNTSDDDGFYFDPRDSDAYTYSRRYAPIDNDTAALRQELWLLTDFRYKTALETFIGERGRRVQKVDKPDRPADFSSGPIVEKLEPVDTLALNRKRWEGIVRAVSARFRSQPLIHASDVDFMATSQVRYLLTSEGTRLRTNLHNYSAAISVETRADDGMPISLETVWKSHQSAGMPDSVSMARAADSLATLLLQLREAPIMEPYTGPALIRRGLPESSSMKRSVIDSRATAPDGSLEGHTFKHKMNQRIIPAFLDVFDDPPRRPPREWNCMATTSTTTRESLRSGHRWSNRVC